ncbi:hypothetical protein BDN70DRAFT_959338 [Pholiota conissans]|uniref:Uncharacterized protein n=1 Tax=Pholiota conissans TaxID=109636 RepID=A0A9P5YSS3_9AGAR|nr:hypothetical protein BDN70DRAFT_959338 [Pholiota conissans]
MDMTLSEGIPIYGAVPELLVLIPEHPFLARFEKFNISSTVMGSCCQLVPPARRYRNHLANIEDRNRYDAASTASTIGRGRRKPYTGLTEPTLEGAWTMGLMRDSGRSRSYTMPTEQLEAGWTLILMQSRSRSYTRIPEILRSGYITNNTLDFGEQAPSTSECRSKVIGSSSTPEARALNYREGPTNSRGRSSTSIQTDSRKRKPSSRQSLRDLIESQPAKRHKAPKTSPVPRTARAAYKRALYNKEEDDSDLERRAQPETATTVNLTLGQRMRKLRKDKTILMFSRNYILCKCGRFRKLDNRNFYYLNMLDRHKEICPGRNRDYPDIRIKEIQANIL